MHTCMSPWIKNIYNYISIKKKQAEKHQQPRNLRTVERLLLLPTLLHSVLAPNCLLLNLPRNSQFRLYLKKFSVEMNERTNPPTTDRTPDWQID